jgi:hypothetical protein
MPIPKPRKGEEKQDFISRCMGNETMLDDYPDNKQRAAVCYASWRKAKGEPEPEGEEQKMDKENVKKKKNSRQTKDTVSDAAVEIIEQLKNSDSLGYQKRVWPNNELRVGGEKEAKTLTGYAAVFNSLSGNLGGFREKITPGAFKRSLGAGADVRALLNHDPNYVLGRTSAGTLQLEEDMRGLRVNIMPPETQWARDLVESISRGDINQMSFGFRVQQDSWEKYEDENIRTLIDVDLVDVSPVTFPAYGETHIASRSLMGMDVECVEKVLIRAEHKLPLDDNDRSVIRRALDVFADLEAIFKANSDAEKQKATLHEGSWLIANRRRLLNLRERNL